MANTAILALGIPMVPVTLLFGPAVTFVLLVTLGLAGTASAWYFVLSRHVVSNRLAAVVGGWFCGFSPAMLSHASWHPNIISQFLLPFIVWRVMVITRSTRPFRDGALLALLVTVQAFINEEILLFTAMGCGIFLIAVVVQRPGLWSAAWRPLAKALATCTVIAGALLAYPLYIQFAGPMAYHGLSEAVRDYGNDIAAYFAPGSPTVGGNQRANVNLAPNYSEENAFFGWSLALIAVGIVLWLRREVLVRALAATAAFYAVLSLGERVSWWDRELVVGPWEWLVRLPLLDAVVPTRFGMITSVVVAILLALAIERTSTLSLDRRTVRTLTAAGLVLALLPITPMPLPMTSRPPVPDFITSDRWRAYVAPDQTLVPIPVPSMGNTHGMRWAAATNLDFKIPGGYFLAPRNGNTGDPGRFGGRPSGIGKLLEEVATTGRTPELNDRQRRRSLDELRYWRAAILVLPVRQRTRSHCGRPSSNWSGRPARTGRLGVGRTVTHRPPGLMSVGTLDREAQARPRRRWRLRPGIPDLAVVAGYLALAGWLTSRQWGRPDRLFHQAGDQILFEWMLAHAARVVSGRAHPLWSDALNAPDGVNLMANTSVLGLGVPLAPVTLLFGSQVAFGVAVVGCLAGTATAWYVLLRRRLVESRLAPRSADWSAASRPAWSRRPDRTCTWPPSSWCR